MTDTDLATIREIQMVLALQYYVNGDKKEKACEKAGISVSTFDRMRATNPRLVGDFIAKVRRPLEEMYETIFGAELKVIQDLVQTTNKLEELNVKDKLALGARLSEIRKAMEEQLSFVAEESSPIIQVPEEEEKPAPIFELPSPNLKRGRSITAIETTTTTLILGDDGQEVIEGKTLDNPE